MNHSIRGSDVFIKEDMKAGFRALQRVAAAYPAGEYRAGFLAALEAVRLLFDIKADGLADLPDLPPAVVDSVRVPPIERPALAVAEVADLPPAGWRRLNVAPVVPVDVSDADRVVEIERGDHIAVVRPDLWRLVATDSRGWIYDEIAGPERLILPADGWVPVPVAFRHKLDVGPVLDTWAVFFPLCRLAVERKLIEILPDGRRQLRG